ncbi:Clp protease ClpP [Roseovarius sp. PS-C2]|uniref:head maturation protease, ClpP-related n=1 Tax=Roseovarius sp. PS-C2 TaxID=2820814 RepID=UPI001C0D06A7|nr:head maturation protease, ClpP-related [Roseovarius sp. PS-C2]MBU3262071.1 Clp protease ClpP [Roseovarius sp. PS-C2]
MTLKSLPEIKAGRMPETFAFEADPQALDRWSSGIKSAQAPENTITILDVIGEDIWGEGVTSKRVAAALRRIGDQEVFVDINSPGGDFFEGVAIYNLLRQHSQKVNVRILGLAASAASVIAMAGDDIQIGRAGFLMIHNAWVIAIGNRHDMRDAADVLEPFDDAMAAVYAAQSGVEKSKVAEWMDQEKWFNGEQAVEAGLADGLLPADAVAEGEEKNRAQNSTKKVDTLLAKAGMPRSERRALLGDIKGGTQNAAPPVTHDADDWTAAAAQLITAMRS